MSSIRIAMLSDTHLAAPGTPDGRWNNTTCLSISRSILDAALADIVKAGHTRVLVLGDVSDLGDHPSLTTALQAFEDAGLRPLVVAGNHDVASSPDALAAAMAVSGNGLVLQRTHSAQLTSGIEVFGHGLRSTDGGQTCTATALPDSKSIGDAPCRLLVWASHYPVLSQQTRLAGHGLRYPGDLLNLPEVHASLAHFSGPVLVVHGHLHTAAVDTQRSMLQIGVPSAVEWPHAWTDARIDLTDDGLTVETTMTSISGHRCQPEVNTVLDDPHQQWSFGNGRWERV